MLQDVTQNIHKIPVLKLITHPNCVYPSKPSWNISYSLKHLWPNLVSLKVALSSKLLPHMYCLYYLHKIFASSHNSIKMYTSILSLCSISNFDDFYIELLAFFFFSTKKLALGCSEHHIFPPNILV